MNIPRVFPTTAAATMLALAAAACGSGSSHASLSKPAYIKRADAICLKASGAEKALAQPASGTQRVAYVKHLYAIERGVVRQLRTLRPPASDAATINGMLANVDRALAFESDVESAAMGGNQSQINTAESKGAMFLHQATTTAVRYGFKECGNT